jgi:hypothetical protein
MALEQGAPESLAHKTARLLRAFAADPVGVSRSLPGEFLQKHGSIKYSPA